MAKAFCYSSDLLLQKYILLFWAENEKTLAAQEQTLAVQAEEIKRLQSLLARKEKKIETFKCRSSNLHTPAFLISLH